MTTPPDDPRADEGLVEAMAEAIWDSLEGDTHDGTVAWGHYSLRNSAPELAARITKMARAALAAARSHGGM